MSRRLKVRKANIAGDVRKPNLRSHVRNPDNLVDLVDVGKPDRDSAAAWAARRRELTTLIARRVQEARHRFAPKDRWGYRGRFKQERIAEVLGISRPAYMALEQCRRKITAVELLILAEFYKVSVPELLAGDFGGQSLL